MSAMRQPACAAPPTCYAPGQTAVTYVDNVRRYYEILMWIDSRETFTNQQDLPLEEPLPAG